jgi:hypothetical protein
VVAHDEGSLVPAFQIFTRMVTGLAPVTFVLSQSHSPGAILRPETSFRLILFE